MNRKHEEQAKVFKAFCNEHRLQILERLRSGETCACNLQELLGTSQSNLSHHMKILVESGVVRARQKGKWTYYSIDSEGVAMAKNLLDEISNVS